MTIGITSPERLRQIIADVQALKQRIGTSEVYRPHSDSPTTGICFLNNSGQTIPAYSIMAVTSWQDFGDGTEQALVAQPGTTLAAAYLLNGDWDVPNGEPGQAQSGPIQFAAFDSGTPTFGQVYGPKNGQGTVSLNYPGAFTVGRVVDSTNKIMQGTLQPIQSLIGKTTGSWASGASQTINIWVGAGGSETVSSGPMTVTAWNRTSATIATTKFVQLSLINGVWYGEPLEC